MLAIPKNGINIININLKSKFLNNIEFYWFDFNLWYYSFASILINHGIINEFTSTNIKGAKNWFISYNNFGMAKILFMNKLIIITILSQQNTTHINKSEIKKNKM